MKVHHVLAAGLAFVFIQSGSVAYAAFATVYDVVATYGGDPTGANDNTTAFNNARSACQTGGGGVIWFQAGTFKFNNSISNTVPGCSIQGTGPNSTILKYYVSGSGNFLTMGGWDTGVTGLQFANGGSWTSGYALRAQGSFGYYQDLYFNGTPSAVHISNAAETRFDRVLMYNLTSSHAVLCDNSAGAVYSTRWSRATVGTSGTNTTTTGFIQGNGCYTMRLETVNVVQGNQCVNVQSGSSFFYATDLECDHTQVGAIFEGGDAVYITNSYFSSSESTSDGNGVNFTPSFIGDANITNSRVFGNANNGILVNGGVDVNIVGNNIGANANNAGVAVGAGVSNFTITGNRIGNINGSTSGTYQTYCVIVNAGASNGYVISSNNCMGNANGVSDGGTGTKKSVTGNVGP